MSILEVLGLTKIYGRRRVVDGVDFHIEPGEIVGLLGPKGAGKTTSFRLACGLAEPCAGKIMLSGIDATSWPMHRRIRDGRLAYLAHESSVFLKLTVEENLLGMLELLGIQRQARKIRCDELLEQFNLTNRRAALAVSLSRSERRRLEIARCLVSNSRLILLDEPFNGIEPVAIGRIQELLRNLRNSGVSFLITSERVHETLAIADRSYVIRGGRILCQG